MTFQRGRIWNVAIRIVDKKYELLTRRVITISLNIVVYFLGQCFTVIRAPYVFCFVDQDSQRLGCTVKAVLQ